MTESNRLDNAAAEWLFARKFLAASDLLAAGGMADRAIAQLYFAVLHAVRALLFTEGIEPRTHRGARHLLNVHFVVPGRLAAEHLRLTQDLQDERDAADYLFAYPNDPARARELRSRADRMLEEIAGLLRAAGVSAE